VLQYGTGRAAAIGQFAAGKTGTTSNYGDAWFVGWDSKYTVAVWVGYPTKLIPMSTDFNGQPVLGGTFPALIWHDFMTAALQVDKARAEHASVKKPSSGESGEATGAPAPEAVPPSSSSPGTAGKGANPSGNGNANGTATPGATGQEGAGGAAGKGGEQPASPPAPPPAAQAPATPPASATPPTSSSPSATGGVGPAG
jgi:penicillin-binding protein 1A